MGICVYVRMGICVSVRMGGWVGASNMAEKAIRTDHGHVQPPLCYYFISVYVHVCLFLCVHAIVCGEARGQPQVSLLAFLLETGSLAHSL